MSLPQMKEGRQACYSRIRIDTQFVLETTETEEPAFEDMLLWVSSTCSAEHEADQGGQMAQILFTSAWS